MTARYHGQPFLRLLECYVLDSIGELNPNDRSNLERMAPKLREVYKLDGDWRTIISAVMHFPTTMDDSIRALWEQNRNLAAQNGEELLAEDFARMIVDENWASE